MPCEAEGGSPSSSPLDMMAWLSPSSAESSSESLRERVDVDLGLLGRDDPSAGDAKDAGVKACETTSGRCRR